MGPVRNVTYVSGRSMQYISDITIHDFETSAGPVGGANGDRTWQATRDRLKELMPAESFDADYA